MKKLFLIPITFLLITALSGCIPEQIEIPEANVIQDERLGYTINYPEGWTYNVTTSEVLVITKGPDSIDPVIQIQKYKKDQQNQSAEQVLQRFKGNISVTKAEFSAEKDFKIDAADGTKLVGKQIVTELPDMGVKMWIVIVENAKGDTIYQWLYNSTTPNYKSNLDIAEDILDSWQIN